MRVFSEKLPLKDDGLFAQIYREPKRTARGCYKHRNHLNSKKPLKTQYKAVLRHQHPLYVVQVVADLAII